MASPTDTFEELSQFHIHATSSIPERWPRTLKHGDSFALFDQLGDIIDPQMTPGGMFYRDTRHLSRLELRLQGQRPLLLSSTIEDQNVVFRADLSNPDIYRDGHLVLPIETIHVRRSKFLWDGKCYERIAIHNFDTAPHKCLLTIRVDADFKDLFEIRGTERKKCGETKTECPDGRTILFRYRGLDRQERATAVVFDPAPMSVEDKTALYSLELQPHERKSLFMIVSTDPKQVPEPYSMPYRAARRNVRTYIRSHGSVRSSNEFVDRMFSRAHADLRMLCTSLDTGPYPYAGTPWFNTPFGRDGIITALLTLWSDPEIASGVLRFLAATQATKTDNETDAQPGKILHEMRRSEMAQMREVPFGKYYGSIDATPLYVILAGRYFDRTGDLDTIRELWPNIDAALSWIDQYGDCDGDGFVEYESKSANGLANQGWKDSHDSISHEDGRLAEGPIALCEVQGYVYAAKRRAASLMRHLGDAKRAKTLEAEAEALRKQFEEKFWQDDLGVYAIALDGKKKPCRIVSSNAGQVLLSGIAAPERAARVADTLLTPECFSGWGIRTLATSAIRYNPIAYHNGSVWPHDNALIALGFKRYGLRRQAMAIFTGMFSAAIHMDSMRFPELFCGFARRGGTAPTLYPVACVPQAWATVAPFAFLESCLGLNCDGVSGEIHLENPALPDFAAELEVRNIAMPEGAVDLSLHCHDGQVGVIATARHGNVPVHVLKQTSAEP